MHVFVLCKDNKKDFIICGIFKNIINSADYSALSNPDFPSASLLYPVLRAVQVDALEIPKAVSSMKNTVRVERAIKDITQQQLADAIGVSRNTINSIESGKYVPSTVLALKIARYFDKSTDSIFQLDEND